MGFHARMRQLMAIVCWLIAIVALFAAIARAVQLVVHGRLDAGTSTVTSIIVTVAYWLFALAVGWIAVTLSEQALAQRTPERTYNNRNAASLQASRRPNSKFVIGLLGFWAIVLSALAVTFHARWRDSVFLQHHGIPVSATLISIENNHTLEGFLSKSDPQTLIVRYANPVLGQTSGQIHYPEALGWTSGTTLNVLVDPRHPCAAAVSGVLNYTKSDWIVLALMAAILITFEVYALYAAVHRWRQSRTPSAVAPSA